MGTHGIVSALQKRLPGLLAAEERITTAIGEPPATAKPEKQSRSAAAGMGADVGAAPQKEAMLPTPPPLPPLPLYVPPIVMGVAAVGHRMTDGPPPLVDALHPAAAPAGTMGEDWKGAPEHAVFV